MKDSLPLVSQAFLVDTQPTLDTYNIFTLTEKVEQELACLQDNEMISPDRFSDGLPQFFLLLKAMGLFASVEIIKLQQF